MAMKIKLKILILASILMIMNACDNKDFISDEVSKGAMVYITTGNDDSGLVNILDLNATNLNFTVSLTDAQGRNLEFAPVESIDITITFNNASEGTSHKTILQNITSWPQTFNLNAQELVGLYDANVVTVDSLDLGDSFFVTTDFHMQDGRFLSGWSPALLDNSPASIYRVFVSYPVGCPSDIAGTYLAECINCPNGELQSQTVTLTEVSAGTYTMSDITMDIFGPNFPIAYNISDICGQIVPAAASRDFGTQIALEAQAGSQIDFTTGVITLNLQYASVACCGLAGLQLSYTLTPQ